MSNRLYVGNLSFETSSEELQAAFSTFGATSAEVVLDHEGLSKCFGYVEVADDQAVRAITSMNGRRLNGRSLSVSEARAAVEAAPVPEKAGKG
jgi:cold-inducible RNA-binding protein